MRLILIMLFALLALPASAATFTKFSPRNFPEMGCEIKLTGPIVPGDLDSLRNLVQGSYGRNLCLHSNGGSYSEGLKLAEFLLKEGVKSPWTNLRNRGRTIASKSISR